MLTQRPLIRWVGVAALAFIAAVSVARSHSRAEATMRSWGATTEVFVAMDPLAPGAQITAANVHRVLRPRGVVPETAVTTAALGTTLVRSVSRGDILVAADLNESWSVGARLESDQVALVMSSGGLPVTAGDRVVIVIAASPSVDMGTADPLRDPYMDVHGIDASVLEVVDTSATDGFVDSHPSVVVALPASQGARVAAAQGSGRLRLLLGARSQRQPASITTPTIPAASSR